MNDRDWLRKRSRGPAGGCAQLTALGLVLIAAVHCAETPVPAPASVAPAPPPAAAPPPEVELPATLPVAMPNGGPSRCLIGQPGRIVVDGARAARPGGPVDALLADPQARVRPDLQGRVGLPLLTLTGPLSPTNTVRVTGCDGAERVIEADLLSPFDAVVLVDDRAGGVDLVDSRQAEPLVRGVSWITRR